MAKKKDLALKYGEHKLLLDEETGKWRVMTPTEEVVIEADSPKELRKEIDELMYQAPDIEPDLKAFTLAIYAGDFEEIPYGAKVKLFSLRDNFLLIGVTEKITILRHIDELGGHDKFKICDSSTFSRFAGVSRMRRKAAIWRQKAANYEQSAMKMFNGLENINFDKRLAVLPLEPEEPVVEEKMRKNE